MEDDSNRSDDLNPVLSELRSVRRLAGLSDDELCNWWADHALRSEARSASVVDVVLAVADEVECRVTGRGLNEIQAQAGFALATGRIVDRAPREDVLLAVVPAMVAALSGEPFHVLMPAAGETGWAASRLSERLSLLGVTVADDSTVKHGGSLLDERREAHSADVVVMNADQAAWDYLRDQLANSVDQRAGIRCVRAMVVDADDVLLDSARVPLAITNESESALARIPLGEFLQGYDQLCGVTPVTMSRDDRDELAGTYGLSVVQYGPESTPVEIDWLEFLSADTRRAALAVDVEKCAERGQGVIVAVDRASLESTSEFLAAEGIRHAVVVGRNDGTAAV